MDKIDELSKDKVYADPVKKVQEEMLSALIEVRQSMADSIEAVLKSGVSTGGVSAEEFKKA